MGLMVVLCTVCGLTVDGGGGCQRVHGAVVGDLYLQHECLLLSFGRVLPIH